VAYKLEGQLLEVCDCKILCPCWVGEDADNGTCRSMQAYHIQKGTIGGVDVSGLTVAEVDFIPANILKGNWKGVFFIDDRATPDQDRALRQAFSGELGGPLKDVNQMYAEIRWERAPVTFRIEQGKGTLVIGGVAEAAMEPYRGPDGTVTTLRDSIFSTIPGSPAYVAKAEFYRRSTQAKYGLPDVDVRGHNAIQGVFRFEA
jgi:hypothetical protein